MAWRSTDLTILQRCLTNFVTGHRGELSQDFDMKVMSCRLVHQWVPMLLLQKGGVPVPYIVYYIDSLINTNEPFFLA